MASELQSWATGYTPYRRRGSACQGPNDLQDSGPLVGFRDLGLGLGTVLGVGFRVLGGGPPANYSGPNH